MSQSSRHKALRTLRDHWLRWALPPDPTRHETFEESMEIAARPVLAGMALGVLLSLAVLAVTL